MFQSVFLSRPPNIFASHSPMEWGIYIPPILLPFNPAQGAKDEPHGDLRPRFQVPPFPNDQITNNDFSTPYTTAGKTFNIHYDTPDNVTLGAWFILSDSYYQTHQISPTSSPNPRTRDEIIKHALKSKPTILFLHGTAGTRATASRIQHYSTFTTRLDANVLAVDYRGFAESSGLPSESGLETDAYTSWKWILQHGAKQEDVLILGHSLGTGVASKLGRRLALEGAQPKGIALIAPFTSFAVLLEDYPLFGVPILQPLQSFAWGRSTCFDRHTHDPPTHDL